MGRRIRSIEQDNCFYYIVAEIHYLYVSKLRKTEEGKEWAGNHKDTGVLDEHH